MKKMILLDVQDFKNLVGSKLGKSSWITVDQNKINEFAKATDDYQWIHTDEEKAKSQSPFKKTVAHGYYTLSLLPKFFYEVWECKNVGLVLNYGSEKIRFISPVLCNSKIRADILLLDAYDYKNGVMLKSKVDIEIKDSEKLAMSAETLSLLYSGS